MDVVQKLTHLVPHWIEHNDSHVEQLATWATQAREAGLGEVAGGIETAARAMKQATGALQEVLAQVRIHHP
jgi:hypothetical protein